MKVSIVLSILIVGVCCQDVLDVFSKCKMSDPDLSSCIIKGVEDIRPRLKTGIPEVNLPALEPFTVPKLKLDRTAANLRIKATVKQAVAYGGSNFKIEKLRINLNNKYAAEAKIHIPKLFVMTDYDVKGSRILTLDISGKGRLKGNFSDITAVVKGLAKPISKDGVEYLQVDKVVAKVRIGNAQIAVDDTERAIAAASAATFFNASPRTILDIISPLVEETAAAVIKAYANKVLGGIPLNKLLHD